MLGEFVVDRQNPLHHVLQLLLLSHALGLVLRPLEGVLPRQHRVQHHPARPDVRPLAVVVAVRDDLGRHVQVGADLGLGDRVVLVALGVAEVADLEQRLDVVGQQRVLELDVSVDHPLVVHVVHSADELLEEPARLILRETVAGDHKVEQVAACGILHRDADVLFRENHLLELDDVRVVQVAVVVDLALHVFADLAATLDELDGDLLVGVPGPCQLHKAEAAAVEVADLLIARVGRLHQWVRERHGSCQCREGGDAGTGGSA
mmetsp:Transcript_33090/g.85821  ORF Transcript_33090/g.85821 Transcript_33090/m.85821 type:complete len:262 (-) Transcript_33090:156-941(-)